MYTAKGNRHLFYWLKSSLVIGKLTGQRTSSIICKGHTAAFLRELSANVWNSSNSLSQQSANGSPSSYHPWKNKQQEKTSSSLSHYDKDNKKFCPISWYMYLFPNPHPIYEACRWHGAHSSCVTRLTCQFIIGPLLKLRELLRVVVHPVPYGLQW